METKANYAIAGLFVLALGGTGIALAMWLLFANEPRVFASYVAYVDESVAGLSQGAAVKYRGVDVGKVREISLLPDQPGRVRLVLDIVPGTPIRADTVAILASQGLTGLGHLELTGGSAEAAPLSGSRAPPYPELRTGPSLLVRVDSAVTTLLAEMNKSAQHLSSVAVSVQALLASQNIDTAARVLKNIDRVSESLAVHLASLSSTIEDVNRMSGDAARVSAELPRLVERLGGTLVALEKTAGSIAGAAQGVGDLTGDARKELRRMAQSTMPEVTAVLSEVRNLALTLNRLSQQLERDPARLLRGSGRLPGPGE